MPIESRNRAGVAAVLCEALAIVESQVSLKLGTGWRSTSRLKATLADCRPVSRLPSTSLFLIHDLVRSSLRCADGACRVAGRVLGRNYGCIARNTLVQGPVRKL